MQKDGFHRQMFPVHLQKKNMFHLAMTLAQKTL